MLGITERRLSKLAALLCFIYVVQLVQSRTLDSPDITLSTLEHAVQPSKDAAGKKLLTEAAKDLTSLPEAEIASKCDSLKQVAEKLVVVAIHNEDINWLVRQVEVPFLAYQPTNSTLGTGHQARVHSNGAYEASAYLQFIAEYYDCLPEVAAFVHGHRSSWHSHDMVEDLQSLKWGAVPGYMPLHTDYFQPYGMYFETHLENPAEHLQTQLATGAGAQNVTAYTSGQVINGTAYDQYESYRYRQALEIRHAWQSFFEPAGLGEMPTNLQYYCCAQFTVTYERIQRLPRQFYLQAIHWATHGAVLGHFPVPYTKGLILESLWHYLFGEPAFMQKASYTELCDHYTCKESQ